MSDTQEQVAALEAAPPPETSASPAGDMDPSAEHRESVDSAAENAGAVEQSTAPGEKRKFIVKVDGEELEVGEDELVKGYSRGKASARRFEEAAKQRKQVEAVLQALRDPAKLPAVLRTLGVDPREIFDQWKTETEAWDGMSEAERERAQLLHEKKQLEREREEWLAKQREERLSKEAGREQQRLTQEFNQVLTARNLPQTPKSIALMAKYMEAALDAGHELTVEDAADLLEEDYGSLRKSSLEGLSPDQVEQLLGKEWLDNLRKWDLARHKESQRDKVTPKDSVTSPKQKRKRRVTSLEEFKKFLDE